MEEAPSQHVPGNVARWVALQHEHVGYMLCYLRGCRRRGSVGRSLPDEKVEWISRIGSRILWLSIKDIISSLWTNLIIHCLYTKMRLMCTSITIAYLGICPYSSFDDIICASIGGSMRRVRYESVAPSTLLSISNLQIEIYQARLTICSWALDFYDFLTDDYLSRNFSTYFVWSSSSALMR